MDKKTKQELIQLLRWHKNDTVNWKEKELFEMAIELVRKEK